MSQLFIQASPQVGGTSSVLAKELGFDQAVLFESMAKTDWEDFSVADLDALVWFWPQGRLARTLTKLIDAGLVVRTGEDTVSLNSRAPLRLSFFYYSNKKTNCSGNAVAPVAASDGQAPSSCAPVREGFGKAVSQKALFDAAPKRKRGLVGKPHRSMIYAICYGTSNPQEELSLNSQQRGRVADALNKLARAGADLDQLPQFQQWWTEAAYFGRDGTPPRPDQILEFWFTAKNWVDRKRNQQSSAAAVPHLDDLIAQEVNGGGR